MSPSSKIKFGIIGYSRVAKKSMISAITESSFAEVVAIGSRDSKESSAISEEFGKDFCASYEDILNNESIDAVYISLPNALHEKWTVRAADAGKHVLCEKPAAVSYESAKRMVEAAKKNNIRLMEGLMFRYHPQHKAVKNFIKEGTLGDLLRFEGCVSFPMPDSGSNMMSKSLGGGSFNDSMPYPLCASRMIFEEEPISAACSLKREHEGGVDVKADMLLLYAGGRSALISSAFGGYFQSTYSVLGSKARIKMGRAYAVPKDMGTKIFLDREDTILEISIEPEDHFKLMVDDFSEEVLRSDNAGKNYEEDLLAQARVMEAGRISDKERRVVQISEVK